MPWVSGHVAKIKFVEAHTIKLPSNRRLSSLYCGLFFDRELLEKLVGVCDVPIERNVRRHHICAKSGIWRIFKTCWLICHACSLIVKSFFMKSVVILSEGIY